MKPEARERARERGIMAFVKREARSRINQKSHIMYIIITLINKRV